MIRVPGHFGELLQGRLGTDGPVVLVTLPCERLGVEGRLLAGRFGLHTPGQRIFSPALLRRFLKELGLPLPGRMLLRPLADVGLGTGISTASLVAVARLAGYRGPPEDLARACLHTEGASDPLMFRHPERRLWASRRGETLAFLPALPRFEVVGGYVGPARRTDPSDERFADVSDLVEGWTRARQLAAFAELASESAHRTQAMRGAGGADLAELVRELGALGCQIAHTGAAQGLIFAPGHVPRHVRDVLREAGFRGVIRFRGGEG